MGSIEALKPVRDGMEVLKPVRDAEQRRMKDRTDGYANSQLENLMVWAM